MTNQIKYDPGAFSELGSRARQAMSDIMTALRKNLTIRFNLNLLEVSKTFGGTPDADTTVDITSLGISWVPRGIINLASHNGGFVYVNSVTGWTNTSITVRCTKASTVAVIGVY